MLSWRRLLISIAIGFCICFVFYSITWVTGYQRLGSNSDPKKLADLFSLIVISPFRTLWPTFLFGGIIGVAIYKNI